MKFIGLFAGVTLAVASLFGGHSAAAGSASLALSPSGATYNVGDTFGLTISETSTDAVNVVTADLAYDAAKLQYIGVDASGSAFGGDASTSGGGGSVSISRYVTPAGATVTGTKQVAVVNFKALAGSGSATISFAGSSKIASNGMNVWNGDTTGGTYNFATPAPAPPTGGQGGSSGSGSGSGSTTNKQSNAPAPASRSTGGTVNPRVAHDPESTSTDTTATSGEVKSDTGTSSKQPSAKTNEDAPQPASTTKSGRSAWPWVVLALIAVALATYVARRRAQSKTPVNDKVVTDASAKKKGEKTPPVAPALAATKNQTAKKKAAKKTNKRSR